MRIAISGASGLLGSALTCALTQRGDEVVALVRRPAKPRDNPLVTERQWDPTRGVIGGPGLTDVEAVVNLAGAPIAGGPWTRAQREKILSSRVSSTRTLTTALTSQTNEVSSRPLFLSGSAVGFYGYDRGDEILTEQSGSGTGFLAQVCQEWEAAATPARENDCTVTLLRTANVLSPRGGFLGALRPLFWSGLGGRIGDGKQWLSWIHVDDHIRAMLSLLDSPVDGPVNLTAPNPVPNADFTAEYADVLARPAVIPFPRPLARLVLTPLMVRETIAAGQRAVPAALQNSGFSFDYPDLGAALKNLEEQRKKRR